MSDARRSLGALQCQQPASQGSQGVPTFGQSATSLLGAPRGAPSLLRLAGIRCAACARIRRGTGPSQGSCIAAALGETASPFEAGSRRELEHSKNQASDDDEPFGPIMCTVRAAPLRFETLRTRSCTAGSGGVQWERRTRRVSLALNQSSVVGSGCPPRV